MAPRSTARPLAGRSPRGGTRSAAAAARPRRPPRPRRAAPRPGGGSHPSGRFRVGWIRRRLSRRASSTHAPSAPPPSSAPPSPPSAAPASASAAASATFSTSRTYRIESGGSSAPATASRTTASFGLHVVVQQLGRRDVVHERGELAEVELLAPVVVDLASAAVTAFDVAATRRFERLLQLAQLDGARAVGVELLEGALDAVARQPAHEEAELEQVERPVPSASYLSSAPLSALVTWVASTPGV